MNSKDLARYLVLGGVIAGLSAGTQARANTVSLSNTGNAIHTPSHLHFGINQNDEMVDPYPLLARATPTQHARLHVDLGGGFGTR